MQERAVSLMIPGGNNLVLYHRWKNVASYEAGGLYIASLKEGKYRTNNVVLLHP